MFQHCGTHFAATLAILPTLVILQGSRVSKWVSPVLPPTRVHDDSLHEARLNGERVLVCSFSHPSARGALRWGDRLDAPYLTETVAPTLTKALRIAAAPSKA